MAWYSGIGVDDLIVPTDGRLSDRLPSPESWSKWGVDDPEMYPWQYKSDAFDYYSHSAVSTNQHDFRLDHSGFGCVDDIFVSSLRDELPAIENLDEAFGASAELPWGNEKFDKIDTAKLELQNSSGSALSVGSSRYLKTHAFSPSSSLEKDQSCDSDIVSYSLTGKSDDFIEGPCIKESMPSEKNCMSGNNDEETSEEEAVLCELKMIVNQLTDETRMCFRDSLYRLAKNWDKPCSNQNEHKDLFLTGIPPWSTRDAEMMRSEAKRSTELETNRIDRAVASLMFNKMDFNTSELPTPVNFELYPTQTNCLSDCEIPLGDAEVPIFGQTLQNAMENLKSGDGSGKESLVLNFGSSDE